MKKYLSLFLIWFAIAAATVAQVLTQQDVVKLLELKIPEQTIIEKVKASGTAFVLGTEDIARLKKAGASDALIAAMQSSSSAGAATGAESSEITDLALIVDYSGSMNAKMKDGATKVASAKKCVTDLIDKLPTDLNVALIVYGTSKKRGCDDIDIVQPLGPIDKPALKSKVTSFNATGMTPIASSLTKAGDELKKAKGGIAIVLVTDGAETCHGDPARVAAELAAEFGVKFGINVIGFGIEPQEKAQLADIAAKGHGKLLTVENASELASALQKVVAEKVAPAPKQRETKEYEAGGASVKPGVFFGDAAIVKPGDYKGTLAMKEAKFYQVSLRKGQELRAIGIVQKTPYEARNSLNMVPGNETFSITFYDSSLAVVAREKVDVVGNPTDPATFRATWTATTDGMTYIAIAASDNHDDKGDPVPVYPEGATPKPSAYTLKIKIEGEAAGGGEPAVAMSRSEKTGGNGLNSATELATPTLATTDLKIRETAFFKVAVKKGDVLQVSAAVQKPWYGARNSFSSWQIAATYTLTLYDDDQVQVGQKKIEIERNPPDPQSLSVTWPATTSGGAYISIGAVNSGGEFSPKGFEPAPGRLALQVTTGSGSPAPGEEGAKPAENEKNTETEKPAESPKPSATKAPTDPFAGAESTPG